MAAMNKTRTLTTTTHLPREIMFDIFSRLPIQSLSPCRFVCKDWYNYINNPCFIHLHLSLINQADPSFLLLCQETTSKLYLVDNETQSTSFKAIQTCSDILLHRTVGSCNGLICVSSSLYCESFYICNPITNTTSKLPQSPGCGSYRENNVVANIRCGFGFDVRTKMYKVVRVWSCYRKGVYGPSKYGTGVEIYTLGSRIWRRLEDIAADSFRQATLLVNQSFHWKLRCFEGGKREYYIGSIDIGTEKFEKFKEPTRDYAVRTTTLSVLKDCLCVIDIDYGDQSIVVWMMKDYRVEQSWSKEYVIANKTFGLSRGIEFDFNILREMKDGSVLIEYNGDHGYYDFGREEFVHITIEGVSSDAGEFKGFVHVGSLVSPKSVDSTSEDDAE